MGNNIIVNIYVRWLTYRSLATVPLYLALLNVPLFFNNQNLLSLLITLFSFAFISLLIFFRVKVIEKRSLSSIGFNKNNWLKKYSLGFLIGLVMMSIIVLILLLFGYITVEKKSYSTCWSICYI